MTTYERFMVAAICNVRLLDNGCIDIPLNSTENENLETFYLISHDWDNL